MLRTRQSSSVCATQRGFSLVELMIALLIALFLLGGLVTLLMGTRKTSATQTALSQLQDNQRIAMTIITNVVQKAGYFPDPTAQTLNSFASETFAGVTMPAGQVLDGTHTTSPPGDTFIARFYTPATDPNTAVIDCAGQSNTATSSAPNPNIWFTNVFQVGLVNGTPWLQCQTRTSGVGTVLTVNLIPNVTNISVLYGVGSSAAGDNYSVVQYLDAGQMSVANWANVTVVKVSLTFQIATAIQSQGTGGTTAGQMSTQTTVFTRVIPVMSRAGVDT